MNKIIPFTNSIILYFLFSFFSFQNFQNLKNFFKFFSAANYISWEILFFALYPPPPLCIYVNFQNFPFPYISISSKIFHCIFIHASNNYSLNICSETNIGSTKSCQFNFLQVGCLRCQHPILLPFHTPSRFQ